MQAATLGNFSQVCLCTHFTVFTPGTCAFKVQAGWASAGFISKPAVLHFDAMSEISWNFITCSESQALCSSGLTFRTRGHKYIMLWSANMPIAFPVLLMPATATWAPQRTRCRHCLQMHPAWCRHSCHRSGRRWSSTAAVVCISDPLRLDARAASVQCVETHMWARRLEDVTVVAVYGQAMCARRAWRTAYINWPHMTVTFILNVGSSLRILVSFYLACVFVGHLRGFRVIPSSFHGTLHNFHIVPFLSSIQSEKAVAASSAIVEWNDASSNNFFFFFAVAVLQRDIVAVYVDSVALWQCLAYGSGGKLLPLALASSHLFVWLISEESFRE